MKKGKHNTRAFNEKNPKGFTLIEVMVALLIISLALGAMLRVVSVYTRNLSATSVYAKEQLLIWNEAVRLQLSPPRIMSDATHNRKAFGGDWEVKVEVSPTITELIDKLDVRAHRKGQPVNNNSALVVYIDRGVSTNSVFKN